MAVTMIAALRPANQPTAKLSASPGLTYGDDAATGVRPVVNGGCFGSPHVYIRVVLYAWVLDYYLLQFSRLPGCALDDYYLSRPVPDVCPSLSGPAASKRSRLSSVTRPAESVPAD